MSKNFLVLDDSRVSRMVITSHVKDHNDDWNILEAASADEALEHAKNNTIYAATLDYNMPGKNGLEIVNELRLLQPDIQLVLFTANIQKSIMSESESLNVRFIPKPVTAEKIVDMLDKIEATA